MHDIIDGQDIIGYKGLWTAYATTDVLPYPDDTIVYDMYSDIPAGIPSYSYKIFNDQCGNYSGEGDCYNREHIFPQSFFGKASPMVSDIHHIFPTDGKVNGIRSSYPFGEVSSPSKITTNGSKLGPNTSNGYSGTVFEPIDEYKGDIARALLYMATRYYNEDSGWLINDMVTGSQLNTWELDLMMKWNTQDPVSQKEIDRNDEIYNNQQHNRNPFIDHPEYVDCIWGSCSSGPTIDNIANYPISPDLHDAIDVFANIDDYGFISSAYLSWGTDGIDFPNTIDMALLSGDRYQSNFSILSQPAGTTVYYRISAIYNDLEITVSPIQSYTVSEDLPY
ncbi:MAG: hypothetical protein GY710_15470 [Desulfobacteraceae bacterium]|nr:hypothetical protein [Desulfobacteraceae bacterium]